MTHTDRTPNLLRRTSARTGGALAMLLLAGLLFAGVASATFEQVDTFGDEAGVVNLEYSQGAAVNVGGAGGVPAGSLYTGGRAFRGLGVTQWSPKGELLGHWGNFPVFGIAVHQATGNVYVLEDRPVGKNQIEVYNADGSELITSFGELAASGETISQSPGKIHGNSASGIAIDSSGTVYVADTFADPFGKFPSATRVMVFKPQVPGNFSSYVYAGQEHDFVLDKFGEGLSIDAADNLYVVTEDGVSIEEYDPGSPSTPICRYETPGRQGGIQGMTVDPIRGEVFYFSYKDTKIHQLSACSEGKFKETAKFAATPKPTEGLSALAFNPSLAWDASRPAGVLYGAAASIFETESFEHGQGYIFAAPPAIAPQVESESVAAITATTATLRAQINPKGSPTRYAFQYLTEAAYQANEPADRFAGATEVPLGGAALGSGQEALGAAAALSGLEPDTGYRFRAIATSHCNPNAEEELCEDTGPGQAFHTFPLEAPGLPDNRAWELVSPVQKHGGEVIPSNPLVGSCSECKPGAGLGTGGFPRQSSPDGEAVVYQGFPFSFDEGALIFSEYLSKRTPSGWQTTTLSPLLQNEPGLAGHKVFNAGLTQGLLYQLGPTLSPEAPSEYANLYAQPTGTPSTLSPLLLGQPPNRPPGGFLTLKYAGATPDLSRVFFAANDALTGETPFAPAAQDGGITTNNLYEWAGGQLRLVNVLPDNAEAPPGPNGGTPFGFGPASAHTISTDGSRVFWSSPTGQAYVRIDAESTTAIPDPGKFLAAAADGSKVLLDNGHIYDLQSEAITDLSEGQGGFKGILGQSEDLSRVYFVDSAVLDEGANEQGAVAQAGKDNLYSWQGGTSSFVATLLPGDGLAGFIGDWVASPAVRTAEASPNGRWVTFLSKAQLTGYDNTGPCSLDVSGEVVKVVAGPCSEAFVYDSATGELTCASCNPTGARPLGPTRLTLIDGGASDRSVLQPRYLTDTGRLYFDTQDSLSPFDTNSGVEDVYQYEPEGVGGCKRTGGCINLISAGHEAVDSNFMTMDETGKNVFFTSRDQLVLKDRDELVDLYVARENGGIPSETETARSECQGEACQAAIVPPNDPTPGSSSFEGAGNVDEKKQAKKHTKKHKKKKHAKKHKSSKRAHGRANHNRGGAK